LAWILPYVREALKQTNNFEFRTYANALFQQLEKADVKDVLRFQDGFYPGGQIYQYDRMPYALRALVSEAFFHLFHRGYIAPDAPDSRLNPPPLHMFIVTERGRVWFQGEEPLPEDSEGYLKFLRGHVLTLDSVIDQYVVEALAAFDRDALFASAVMLGAASEKQLYLLADAVMLALKDARKQAKLKNLLDRRKLFDLFEMVRDTIQDATDAKLIPYTVTEGVTPHLMSLFEAIRVQRNDAVHPMNAKVSEESVRHLIKSLPYALAKGEDVRQWLLANPGTI
jgi:sulfur transfer complex TusBCD TusB component (DsrH family)